MGNTWLCGHLGILQSCLCLQQSLWLFRKLLLGLWPYPMSVDTSSSSLPSRIASLVHAHFDALPTRSKPTIFPDGSREWIPMTGIVAVKGMLHYLPWPGYHPSSMHVVWRGWVHHLLFTSSSQHLMFYSNVFVSSLIGENTHSESLTCISVT